MSQDREKRRLRPRTYAAAIYVVGGVVVLQFVLVASIFWFREKVVRNIDLDSPSLPPSTTVQAEFPKRPTPGSASTRLDPEKLTNPKARINILNQEALTFKQQREFRMAEAALGEAEKLDPRNVLTLTNLATLAEEQNDFPKAGGYWKRILELGETAGRKLAEQRLTAITQMETKDKAHRATLGRKISLGPITQSTRAPEPGATEFRLDIPLIASEGEKAIDPGSVGIKLFCYDRTNDGRIVPTIARVTAKFADNNQTWQENRTEYLQASYYLPAGETTRRFHGYLIRIFYQGQLQDEAASPKELLQMVGAR